MTMAMTSVSALRYMVFSIIKFIYRMPTYNAQGVVFLMNSTIDDESISTISNKYYTLSIYLPYIQACEKHYGDSDDRTRFGI